MFFLTLPRHLWGLESAQEHQLNQTGCSKSGSESLAPLGFCRHNAHVTQGHAPATQAPACCPPGVHLPVCGTGLVPGCKLRLSEQEKDAHLK